MADVFSRAAWALRSNEFGALVEHEDMFGDRHVAMELIAPGIDDGALVERLWTLWLGLPWHPNILQAVKPSRPAVMLLRYAALNWKIELLDLDKDDRAAVVAATWGIELTRMYDFITACAPRVELGWFACPLAKIDLLGVPRVAFLSPAGSVALMNRTAPEVIEGWPWCDERAFVFAIGQLLLGLVKTTPRTASSPLGNLIRRCLQPDALGRFQTLYELREALVGLGGRRNSRVSDEREDVWSYIEDGIGYSALGLPRSAMRCFGRALIRDPSSRWASAGYNAMLTAGETPGSAVVEKLAGLEASQERLRKRVAYLLAPVALPPVAERTRDWLEIRPVGRKLEEAGRYRDALEYYHTTRLTDADAVAVLVATARCQLGAGEYGPAIDHARQAIERDACAAEAHAIQTDAWWRRKQFREALDACDAWLEALPDDANAHYLRAKILLGLGRIAEARDECERTTELAPKHLAAMLLRWQLDRSMKRTRARAGNPGPTPFDLPEHLRHLRELLVAGRNAQTIEILGRSDYEHDGTAQLLRADLLALSDQPGAAFAAFDRAATLGQQYALAAGIGKAGVLMSLGSPEEALALCDVLVRGSPDASDAHQARAMALQALGRHAEAEAAFKRALGADAQRSQMHVRLAGR